MTTNRALLACVISAALATGVMFLIGFRPVDARLLEIKNQSLREENRLLKRQVDVLTEQTSVLEQIVAAKNAELAAINAVLASE